MEKLPVHRREDSNYDINWVVENNPMVMMNRNYVDNCDLDYSGVCMVIQDPEHEDWLIAYAAYEEGFLSVSNFTKRARVYEVVSIEKAIQELQKNVDRVVSKRAALQPETKLPSPTAKKWTPTLVPTK